MWRGWAPQATADDYQRHYESEVSGHLRSVDGFRGARLLRLDDGHEVMFTSITFFTSLAVVRGFAGDDYERAVVEPGSQALEPAAHRRLVHAENTGYFEECTSVEEPGGKKKPILGRERAQSGSQSLADAREHILCRRRARRRRR